MKTDKFNHMIEAFECDFVLAEECVKSISELDTLISHKNQRILNDIELLKELSFLLRNGKAEIHILD